MARYDYDLFTIGAGSGGVRASRVSADYGARVAIAEERDLGGTCVNLGCIPKKLLVYASQYAEDFEDAGAYGWDVGTRGFDWKTLLENKDREIARLNGVYAGILDEAGVERLEGRARLVDSHSVEVAGRRYSAENVLVATGAWPAVPSFPGSELALTSNEMFHLPQQPRRALIVGGGYVAAEFAGILHGLGSEVTLLYRGPLFLRGFDEDVRMTLGEEMRKKGIDLRFDARVARLEPAGAGVVATLEDGSRMEADVALYATGRRPLTDGLGLESAGVELGADGAVLVDAYSRSSIPNVWAIGDVTDRLALTPVAIHEGICLARTLFGGEPTPVDHENVATAIFSRPSVGCVGLTEAEARERFDRVDVYRTKFRALKHTLTGRDELTLMKLVVDAGSDRVLGCHMVGPEAGEIIQGLAVALRCGATKAQFDATLGIHPTSAEEFVTLRQKV